MSDVSALIARVPLISPQSAWVPECLENLLERKIAGVAFNCLEMLVDCLLSWIYCPYNALFEAKMKRHQMQYNWLKAKDEIEKDIPISEKLKNMISNTISGILKRDRTKEFGKTKEGRTWIDQKKQILCILDNIPEYSRFSFKTYDSKELAENAFIEKLNRWMKVKEKKKAGTHPHSHGRLFEIEFNAGSGIEKTWVLVESNAYEGPTIDAFKFTSYLTKHEQ